MPQLDCTISPGVWELMLAAAKKTGQPVAHIVNRALAEYLQAGHHTLYQISTATALVEGIYQGAVRVQDLRAHGDHGLGTFEELDGEMVIVNGHFFQVRCDGSVREVADDVLTPFAVITRFLPETEITLDQCPDLRSLASRFDRLRDSDNGYGQPVSPHYEVQRRSRFCKIGSGGDRQRLPRGRIGTPWSCLREPPARHHVRSRRW